MKNLLVWQKLALLGAVFLLPLIFVTGALISSVEDLGLAAAKKELLGVEYTRPLLTLLRDLQHRRALVAGLVARREPLFPAVEKLDEKLAENLLSLDAADARLRGPLRLEDEGPRLAARARALLATTPPGADDAIAQHTAVIDEALSLIALVADRSELILDPELGSYYFMDLFTAKLPLHAEQAALAWAVLAATPPGAAPSARSAGELQRVAALRGFLGRQVRESLRKALANSPGSATRVRLPERLRAVDPPAEAAPDDWPTQAMSDDYELAARAGEELAALIGARVTRLERQIRTSLACGVGGLLLVTLIGLRLMRDITRPLSSLAATARAIEAHDIDARVNVAPREDEIGNLAKALQQMIVAQRQDRQKLVESNLAMLEANEKLQRKTDEAQRLAHEADGANRAKRDFLAVMSHEIRTPMNGIIGMTELALNTELSETQREYLDMVKSSAEVLLELLNDILDFSKIEAGRLELERTPFALRDTLGDTMQTLGVRASAKGLELALQIRPDVPDALLGDPHRLRQIIVNLVGNALKFTDRGEVSVLVERAGGNAGETALRFAVRDTGVGIPAAAREKIFSAFAQADVSTTRRFGGTGLGLAITSQLVGMMGGEIAVESEVGKGSVFSFTARFGVEAAGLPEAGPELENLRVLAVDDNATNRLILRELFTSWRMEVVLADSAEAGLAALDAASRAGQPIALVVTDMMMPEVDGFGLVERIKADPALQATRIIMLTSSNRPEDVARCRALGVGAHLAKPIKQSLLMDTIVDVLGSGQRRPRPVPAAGPVPLQRPLHILLAEDNAVNQRLAVVNLESWGHHVTVAHDGVEAVEAYTGGEFDVVLMDSQMPRMGGFEATAVIRARERETGRRTPIIAMTANVLKGYREECLAAGMDGYVAKPMRREELIAAMAAVIPDLLLPERHAPPRPVEKAAPVPEPSAEPFDAAALLASLGGSRALLAEMVQLCLEADAPRLLTLLREGVERGDLGAVEQAAHGLKGLVGEFHAPTAYAAARQLEETARAGHTAAVPAAALALSQSFAQLTSALRRFAAGEAPAHPPAAP